MYKASGSETFKDLENIPLSDSGNPEPSLSADEYELTLSYFSNNSQQSKVTVKFVSAHIHVFGSPNDETFNSHPLYALGLKPYAVCEVLNSGWIANLEQANSVHPLDNSERFKDLRHFVFAFHDSTFECIARNIELMTS